MKVIILYYESHEEKFCTYSILFYHIMMINHSIYSILYLYSILF